ncbi:MULTISPECIES: hypothetical protein [unclassified Paenibacillus]|uniref:hypothetical protein n=1 Tax=unclassified Paenibacillus TaxID=185978 RepID=UPI00040557FF|nr:MULTISPECIES: hypothetical protein [unclassified Paenibacillus]KGP85292.1 hypothetical protein P364_0101355 [Paenibacillus sp. MAEPY2]KGP88135.1 hypothetical protein P363_0108210 [Paenibacillus sp. MAEPY1]
MYEYFLPTPLRNFIDSIFNGPLTFLKLAIQYLNEVSLVAGRGISLQNYFGFISYLPTPFQAVVNSLLSGIILLAVLQLVKVIIRMYYAIKDGSKWW